MHSLPLFHRIVGTNVVLVGEGEAAEAKRRLILRAGGQPCGETEAHHARLAFVAVDDARAAEAAALRLKRAGLLVNVADRPDLCDFTLGSVLDRDPVLVAVSTGGASAGLAKQLRLRLESILPQSLGVLGRSLHEARERIRSRIPDMSDRRRAIDDALAAGGALDPLVAHGEGCVDRWLADAAAPDRHKVIEMRLSSNDPDDLTFNQARILGEADVIIHDPGVADAILNRARADAALRLAPADPPPGMHTVILRSD